MNYVVTPTHIDLIQPGNTVEVDGHLKTVSRNVMTIIETPSWILKDKADQPVISGQTVTSFRGDKAIVTGGRPPLTEASTGRVIVAGGEYYPSVFNLKWVRK